MCAFVTDEQGIVKVTCDGTHHFLVYNGETLIFHGTNGGEIRTKATVEEFNTEQEMIDRAGELNLTLDEEVV